MNFESNTARKLVNVNNITHLEWLETRKKGIGGSDAPAIARLTNPKYNSPLKVYEKKTEEVVTIEPPHEYAEMGHYYEPTIREIFKDKNPDLQVFTSDYMWQSIEFPFILANIDGLIFDEKKGWGILEIKNLSEYRAKEFGEKVFPLEFQIQISHYLFCLGLKWGKFAVVIGGNKYREYDIERNDDLIKSLIKIEQNFWEYHVLNRIPPEPDGSEASQKILNELYTAADVKKKKDILTLSEETKSLTEAYEFYKEEEKKAKAKKDKARQDLQALLGPYQTAQVEGDVKTIRWTINNAFNPGKVREIRPDLYKEYVKPKFDATAFKKDYPTIHEECMVPTNSRTFNYR